MAAVSIGVLLLHAKEVALFAWCFQLLAAFVDSVPVLFGWFFPSHG